MRCSLVAAWRSILQIKTQQDKRLPFIIIQKTQQESVYFLMAAVITIFSVVLNNEVPFFIQQNVSHDVLYAW